MKWMEARKQLRQATPEGQRRSEQVALAAALLAPSSSSPVPPAHCLPRLNPGGQGLSLIGQHRRESLALCPSLTLGSPVMALRGRQVSPEPLGPALRGDEAAPAFRWDCKTAL